MRSEAPLVGSEKVLTNWRQMLYDTLARVWPDAAARRLVGWGAGMEFIAANVSAGVGLSAGTKQEIMVKIDWHLDGQPASNFSANHPEVLK